MVIQLDAKLVVYIDHYIIVAPEAQAEQVSLHLSDFLLGIGHPMNMDKRSSPSRALTCLGIQTNLDQNTLQIDPEKLSEIYS